MVETAAHTRIPFIGKRTWITKGDESHPIGRSSIHLNPQAIYCLNNQHVTDFIRYSTSHRARLRGDRRSYFSRPRHRGGVARSRASGDAVVVREKRRTGVRAVLERRHCHYSVPGPVGQSVSEIVRRRGLVSIRSTLSEHHEDRSAGLRARHGQLCLLWPFVCRS